MRRSIMAMILALLAMTTSLSACESVKPTFGNQAVGLGLHRTDDTGCAVVVATSIGTFAAAVPSTLCAVPVISDLDFRLEFNVDSTALTGIQISPRRSAQPFRSMARLSTDTTINPPNTSIPLIRVDPDRSLDEQLVQRE